METTTATPAQAPRSLSVADIFLHAGTQVRGTIDPEIVEDYAERLQAGDRFPPITVFEDDEKSLFLADGFHRLAAHKLSKRSEIDACVKPGTREDALWFALGANRTHGQRLSRGDKRRAVELALTTWPDKSQRQIATQIGCSQQYVGSIRQERKDLPERTIGSDGKSYPAQRNAPASADGGDANDDGGQEPEAATGNPDPPTRGEAGNRQRPSQGDQRRADQIVSVVSDQALNLTAQEELIHFEALDPEQLPTWIAELEEGRRRLSRFITRLKQVQASATRAPEPEPPPIPSADAEPPSASNQAEPSTATFDWDGDR